MSFRIGVLDAISGFAGFKFIITAIKAKKKIALANKETLVAGGDYILDLIKKNKILLTPVDSEHSAIFQCLQNQKNILNRFSKNILSNSKKLRKDEKMESFW